MTHTKFLYLFTQVCILLPSKLVVWIYVHTTGKKHKTTPDYRKSVLRLTLGYSPCPNDTFMFYALASGSLSLPGCTFDVQIYDVETLNRMALEQKLDITKLSFYAWLNVKNRYRLLENGAALGYGCGPVVISKEALKVSDIPSCRVVLPGEWTTAHLLFQLWAPGAKNKIFMSYDRIFDLLTEGSADCGVIIHESRFTFKQAGFQAIMDLGAWWEDETGLPVPLGCIAANNRISDALVNPLNTLIAQSITYAHAHTEEALSYIREYAQEMEEDILKKHIRTFVNRFSLGLGETGRAAVAKLEQMARQAGIIT